MKSFYDNNADILLSAELSNCLKMTNAICNDLAKNKNYISFSTENAAGNIKKVISWIIERIKALAKIISEFFEKVKSYLNGRKHAFALQIKDEAMKKIGGLSEQPDHQIIRSLTDEKIIASYVKARLWRLSYKQPFQNIYKKAIREISQIKNTFKNLNRNDIAALANNDNDNDKDELIRIFDSLASATEEKLNKYTAVVANGKNRYSVAIEVLKNYNIILEANDSIQEYVSELKSATDSLNSMADILNKKTAEATFEETDYNAFVKLLREKVGFVSILLNKLLALNIAQSVLAIDKIIDVIHLTVQYHHRAQ
jgi:hypothetical protein